MNEVNSIVAGLADGAGVTALGVLINGAYLRVGNAVISGENK